MREPGEDDERDPTDLGLSPSYTSPEQLPPPIPGAAMSDDEIAARLRALGMSHIEARDVARLDERARAERIAWFERKRREESK